MAPGLCPRNDATNHVIANEAERHPENKDKKLKTIAKYSALQCKINRQDE
jgi:hypothetical protein